MMRAGTLTAIPLLLLAAVLSLLCGCATYTLSDVSVTGPADAPLPRVSDDVTRGTVVVRPYVVVGRAEHVQGEIGERDGDPPADFEWTVPEHMMGGTLDWALSSHFAFVLGAQYAQDDYDEYWGGSFGLALFETGTDRIARRLDFTLAYQEMAYTADYLVVPAGGGDAEMRTFAKQTSLLNPSVMLTLNTRLSWPVNFFLNGGFGSKEYFDFDRHDLSANADGLDFSGRYAFWSPGVYVSLDRRTRVLAGVRFIHPGEIRGDVGALRQGFLQFELTWGD